jgi:hypothetical protein
MVSQESGQNEQATVTEGAKMGWQVLTWSYSLEGEVVFT